ncbi:MAG: ATP-grasp domain-containing protein [Clostridia bacterium]|nr:ATP-grasp domain-containing protein [Clostridia bacterium]
MKKRLMILGASILQLPAILQAKQMGIEVIAADMDPNAIGFGEADEKLCISTIDIPAIQEAAKRLQIDGIMTLASDMPMRTVAAVSEEMGLCGIDMKTAVRATDKAAMRACLQEAGVPCPRFFAVSDASACEAAARELDCDFVVKPADNSGSRGVFFLPRHCRKEELLEAYAYSHRFSRGGLVMVEEYMRGREVSVETLTVDSVCHIIQITDKLTTGAPHFVEMGHSQPTAHDPETVARICQIAADAGKAIGIQNGPSHTEIMVTEDGPKIVELGARLGGDCITTHLTPLSTGVNMVEACIRIALGEKPMLTPTKQAGSAIRYLRGDEGVLRSIEGVEQARQTKGVVQVSIVAKEGERLTEITGSASRPGFVIAEGLNAEEAMACCEQACEKIRFHVEKTV